jgi:Predicted membrane protein (DUF2142)
VQAGERRRWFSLATLLLLAIAAWSLSSPLFSYPDEPAHVIRAESVVRGQFEGKYVGYHKGPDVYPYYAVDVPGVLSQASDHGACLAFLVGEPASACSSSLTGPSHPVELTTYVGSYPPLYYLLVGVPTLVWPGELGIFLMRLLGGAISAGFLASAFMSALGTRRGRVAALGVLAAITPTALYVSSGVSPAGMEISSAVSLWAAGLVLVVTDAKEQTPRLVRRAGLAAVVLVWTRSLSPLWLACILATLLILADRSRRRSLGGRTDLRAWSVAIGASTAGALVWDVAAGGFQVLGKAESPKKSNLTLLGEAFGHTWAWLQGAFGDFGLVDHDKSPTLLLVLCLAVVGVLLVCGLRVATRRQAEALTGLIVFAIILPVVITFADDREYGVIWQGRYGLPLAAGITLLAALLLANSERSEAVWFDRRVWVAYVAVFVANVIGLLTSLHRFVDGSNGPLEFVRGRWQPPVNAAVLIAVFVTAQALLLWTLYREGRAISEPSTERHPLRKSSGDGHPHEESPTTEAAGPAHNHQRL